MALTWEAGTLNRADIPGADTTAGLVGLEATDFNTRLAMEERYKRPMVLMLKQLPRKITKTVDHHWTWDRPVPHVATILYSTGYNSAATALTFASGEGELFIPGSLWQHVVTGEVLYVSSVSGDVVTFVRDFGTGAGGSENWTAKAGAITDSDKFRRMAGAYEPGHPWPDSVHTLPNEVVNYAQQHRTVVSMTFQAMDTAQRTIQDAWDHQVVKDSQDHYDMLEHALWYGKPNRGDGTEYTGTTGGSKPSTMAGIDHLLEANCDATQLLDETEITELEFIDYFKWMFRKGSDSKLFFCPIEFSIAMQKWGLLRQRIGPDIDFLGANISRYEIAGMELRMVVHEGLENPQSGQWNNCYTVDMDNIQYVGFGRFGNTIFDEGEERKATGKTRKTGEWITDCSIKLTNFNEWGRLRFKTAA